MYAPKPSPGVSPGDSWAALTLVEVVQDGVIVGYTLVRKKGVLLQRDGEPPRLRQWKCPGGHKDPGEDDPLLTARRELFEEINLEVPLKDFRHVATWWEGRQFTTPEGRSLVSPHWKSLFRVRIPHRVAMWANDRHPKNGGEKPRYFSNNQFAEVFKGAKFLPEQKEALIRHGLFTAEGKRIET